MLATYFSSKSYPENFCSSIRISYWYAHVMVMRRSQRTNMVFPQRNWRVRRWTPSQNRPVSLGLVLSARHCLPWCLCGRQREGKGRLQLPDTCSCHTAQRGCPSYPSHRGRTRLTGESCCGSGDTPGLAELRAWSQLSPLLGEASCGLNGEGWTVSKWGDFKTVTMIWDRIGDLRE